MINNSRIANVTFLLTLLIESSSNYVYCDSCFGIHDSIFVGAHNLASHCCQRPVSGKIALMVSHIVVGLDHAITLSFTNMVINVIMKQQLKAFCPCTVNEAYTQSSPVPPSGQDQKTEGTNSNLFVKVSNRHQIHNTIHR